MLSFRSILTISPTIWPIDPGPPLPKLRLPLAAATAFGRSLKLAMPAFGFAMITTGAIPSIAMCVNWVTGS